MNDIDILKACINEGNFHLAIKKADEILEHDCNNVQVLLTKAGLYEVINDIDNAKQTYEKVLEIEPEHAGAKDALINISNNEQKIIIDEYRRSNASNLYKHILKPLLIIILLILGIIFIYLHPSKEEMLCNSNLKCNIKHEFLGFLKYYTGIELGADSKLSAHKTCSYLGRRSCTGTPCVVHVNIADKYGKIRHPFIYYYTGYDQEVEYYSTAEDLIKYETYLFNSYLQNPKTNFRMVPRSGNSFILFMAIGFVSIMAIAYTCRLLGIIK